MMVARKISSLAGALDDKAAKRQLLAALDGEFYREVITPLRLDTELAKVAIEEIYNHVLEVWWCAHLNAPKLTPSPTPFVAAYAGGDRSDVQDFLDELGRGHCLACLPSECPLCPGHYHDTARCPAVCGSCDAELRDAAMDMDVVVSAFQTAFDDEDDEQFAEPCQQHDRPLLVREDPDPFTYPKGHDVGLRAHYAGLLYVRTLQREHFDIKVAKAVHRKLFESEEDRFSGNESHASTLFTRLVSALRHSFVTKDLGFVSLFKLDDATLTVRVEANDLLFSTLELLIHPTSPAADWMDSSNSVYSSDGKAGSAGVCEAHAALRCTLLSGAVRHARGSCSRDRGSP
ncbi:hypothetical protein CYMTET_11911 [Cymbomonas tetramitiformis]|uniref:Uncharacterized protein n=1 Tax=Cymbomonas tetramitiformis TaxID=36881 RepID=A0AAE0GL47_9CHLO|nr:hypothetical protein CYMTET_11911 [Cymbomonas tetramitiformis]